MKKLLVLFASILFSLPAFGQIYGGSSGGCSSNCTFTGTTTTGPVSAGGTVQAPVGSISTVSFGLGSSKTGWYSPALDTTASLAINGAQLFQWSGSYFIPAVDSSLTLGLGSFHWQGLYMSFTNTGTVGAVTINKPTGRVNIAAAGTSVVVTNSVVTAAAHIFCNVANVDTTAKSCQATAGAGTMTLTTNASATAQVALDFFVVNAD